MDLFNCSHSLVQLLKMTNTFPKENNDQSTLLCDLNHLPCNKSNSRLDTEFTLCINGEQSPFDDPPIVNFTIIVVDIPEKE